LWASGDFPVEGKTDLPKAAWRLTVKDGLYQTRLGDTAAGMPALDVGQLRTAESPFLRVWFTDGGKGWQAAGDSPIKSALGDSAATISVGQAEQILRELREVRALLQKPETAPKPAVPEIPKTVTVPLGDSPSLGAADAPVVLVEFTDYECSFCKRAHDDVLAALKKKFVETGKLRLVSRNMPLSMHPRAEPAAHAAMCAHAQKQFWPMHDRLFAMSPALTDENIIKAAAELNLNNKAFATCLAEKTFSSPINRDSQDAVAVGITGTPSFVLGRAKDGRGTGPLMIGAKPLAQFEAEITKLLEAK
ncbi:MAG: hypothetical protein RLZZ214_10, partial [Verrucomicrobiota bacterium]